MNLRNDGYEIVPVGAIKRHPKNPRKGDQVAIAESIACNGFYGALIVQRRTGFILAGNHRFEEAKKQNAETIPVIWVDCDDDEAERILLADNRSSDLGDNDEDALKKILVEMLDRSGSLMGTCYDEDFLKDDEPETAETLLDQAVQLKPQREYIVVMCEDEAEFERLKEALDLKLVRRGGYKAGSQFDAPGTERVIKAARLLEKFGDDRRDPEENPDIAARFFEDRGLS